MIILKKPGALSPLRHAMCLSTLLIAGLTACSKESNTQTDSASASGSSTGSSALKIFCAEQGIYRVTGQTLADAGIDPGLVDIEAAALVSHEGSRPLRFELGDDGRFDPQDGFYFYSEGAQLNAFPFINIYEDYTDPVDTFIFYPTGEGHDPVRFEAVSASPAAAEAGHFEPTDAFRRLHFEDDMVWKFFSTDGVHGDETDFLYWSELNYPPTTNATGAFSHSFSMPAARADAPGEVRIQLVGAVSSEQRSLTLEHQVEVKLNGQSLGVEKWPVGTRTVVNRDVPPGLISPDFNELTVEILEPVTRSKSSKRIVLDVVLLDWIQVDMVQETRVENNFTEFRFEPGKGLALSDRFGIRDFLGNDIMIFDLAHNQYWETQPWEQNAQEFKYAVDVVPPESVQGEATRLVALERNSCREPKSVERIDVTRRFQEPVDEEMLVISHPDFLADLERFVEWKESRGLDVELVNVMDIFNEKAAGLPSAEAIRDYIEHAYKSRETSPLKYVLLVGDSSTISKYKTYMPAYSYLESGEHANDNYFVSFTEPDGRPELSVGRFSVRDSDQLNNVIDKVVAYEKGDGFGRWRNDIFLIAASHQWAERDATRLINDFFSPNYGVRYLRTDKQNVDPNYFDEINEQMMNHMNAGNLMTIFFGHGGGSVWEIGPTSSHRDFQRHLFDQENVLKLTNENMSPLVVALTCYTNDFDNPHVAQTIGETFVNSPNGAIAVFGASSRSLVSLNYIFIDSFLRMLKEHRYDRLGDYFLAVKQELDRSLVNGYYILLGDPSLEFSLPAEDIVLKQPELQANGELRVRVELPEGLAPNTEVHYALLDEAYESIQEGTAQVNPGDSSLALMAPATSADTFHLAVWTRSSQQAGPLGGDHVGGLMIERQTAQLTTGTTQVAKGPDTQ